MSELVFGLYTFQQDLTKTTICLINIAKINIVRIVYLSGTKPRYSIKLEIETVISCEPIRLSSSLPVRNKEIIGINKKILIASKKN